MQKSKVKSENKTPAARIAQMRRWQAAHREICRQNLRDWQRNNREKVRAYCREYYARKKEKQHGQD